MSLKVLHLKVFLETIKNVHTRTRYTRYPNKLIQQNMKSLSNLVITKVFLKLCDDVNLIALWQNQIVKFWLVRIAQMQYNFSILPIHHFY